MKYVFFGSPEFAKIILEKLIDSGYAPVAVVCNPDRPVGRKKVVTPPPVKISAEKYGVKVYQPENLLVLHPSLLALKPDLFIVAAYSKIIKKEILDIPKLGTIGIHPSLLPKYRGSSPIQSALLNGETETGVTLYLIDEKIDNGPILANEKFGVKNYNYAELENKLANLGADLLIETLPEFLSEKIKPQKQDHSQATFTKKILTQDAFIENFDLKEALDKGGDVAIEIYNKIRALNPEPGTWTIQDGKRMKILNAMLGPENKLKLKTIQFESKRPQNI